MAMLGQVQSMVAILNGMINAPAGAGVVRFTAQHQEQGFDACTPWWRASVRWIVILLAILIPLGLVLAKPLSHWLFASGDYAWLIIITVLALPFTAMGTLITSVTNGLQQYRRYIGLGMVSTVISSLVMIALIIKQNLMGALLAAALQAGLIGVVMLIASLRQPWFKLRYWWGQSASEERKAIGGYILMAVTSALTIPVSLVMVRNILVSHVGWEQAGQWQAVWKISEVYLGVITMALGTYYLPKLASLSGVDAILKEINSTARIIIPIVAIMALAVYFLRDIAISLLFTEAFRSARDLFAIQLMGDVIKIASWLYAYPMLARGATKWFMVTEVFFSGMFVMFSYFLVGQFGTQGANSAYLLNYILYFLFLFFNVRKISR
ncbi:O-antigen translocase [Deefgea salmonis]|nr:O-antigen translocase [Deefgea salmonis]